jgi:hypothetical protein
VGGVVQYLRVADGKPGVRTEERLGQFCTVSDGMRERSDKGRKTLHRRAEGEPLRNMVASFSVEQDPTCTALMLAPSSMMVWCPP